MKIKQDILDLVNNPQSRTRIAMALQQGEQSIAIACRENVINGTLTKYAVLEVISEETGKKIEEILERTQIPVHAGASIES